MPSDVEVAGTVQGGPKLPQGDTTLSPLLDLGLRATYAQMDAGSFSFTGSSGSPYRLNPGGVTLIRFLVLRAVDGQSIVARLSSAAGGAQAVPISSLFVLHVPNDGDELTAVDLVGSGRIEYLAAGDAA